MEEKDLSWTKFWINDLLKSLESQVDEGTVSQILEQCGRACVRRGPFIGMAEDVKNSLGDPSDIETMLNLMNQRGIGGGKLHREGNVIIGLYEKCTCPVRKGITSPVFCNCTTGWAQEVFETMLEQPVEVELVKAMSRGDKVCEFRVTIL